MQFLLFVCSSSALLTFQACIRPMEDGVSQSLEIYNEATILMVGSLLAPFSADYFDGESAQASYNFGWMIVGLTLANIAVNQISMIVSLMITIFKKVRKLIEKLRKKLCKKKAAKGESKYENTTDTAAK